MKAFLEDIQILLSVFFNIGDNQKASLVTTWYGPKDTTRFAVIKKSDRELDPGEIFELEERAKVIFAERIEELEELFSKVE